MKAQLAKQNADYAVQAGDMSARDYGLKSRFQAGQIATSQAASGVDVNRGSAVDVQKSQKLVSDIDVGTIRNNAARKAYGFQVESAVENSQAKMYDSAASGAKTAGYLGAFSSLLGGVSSVSSKWLQGNSVGLWSGGGGDYDPPNSGSY